MNSKEKRGDTWKAGVGSSCQSKRVQTWQCRPGEQWRIWAQKAGFNKYFRDKKDRTWGDEHKGEGGLKEVSPQCDKCMTASFTNIDVPGKDVLSVRHLSNWEGDWQLDYHSGVRGNMQAGENLRRRQYRDINHSQVIGELKKGRG